MTTEPTPEEEEELRSLLKDSERPSALSPQQRERIRRRLGPALQAGANQPADSRAMIDRGDSPISDAPLELIKDDSVGAQRGRSLLAKAAILVAVVALGLGLLSLREEDLVETANQPAITQPSGPATCPSEIGDFFAAIGLWGDVENWSFLTDRNAPEPDLLSLAVAVLESGALSDASADQELAERLRQLRQTSLDSPSLPWSTVDREEHFEAVSEAELAVSSAISSDSRLASCSTQAEPDTSN